MSQYLGQLVPASMLKCQSLTMETAMKIKEEVQKDGGIRGRKVEVLVTSKNALKMQAAKDSVEAWLQALFHEKIEALAIGFGVSSEIDEQPHGLDHTFTGAANRLKNMKVELAKQDSVPGTLRILISLENGLILEKIDSVKNPEIFKTEDGNVWVDRCVEVGEIIFQGNSCPFEAISEGVTTPKEQVTESARTNWSQTAGSFISKKYGWNAADWHGSIAGKGRKIIMEELAKAGLGHTLKQALPKKLREFQPERDGFRYHQYVTESVQNFASKEIEEMLALEIRKQNEGISLDKVEESVVWRDFYQTQIPQPSKFNSESKQLKPVLGPDGKTPLYSSGPILTEDLLVGYFDEVEDAETHEKRDVLHIVLLWAEEGGWVLPGKRDRAYDLKNADISVKDANYSLVEKELGVKRSEVPYHFILGYFDDRKREERMKSSGFLSFALLNQKPPLDGHSIGIPLNALVQLVQGEIEIPPAQEYASPGVKGFMARNHDSLIINVLDTAVFYQTMEKVKRAQKKFKENLRANPRAARPAISEVASDFECSVCMDLLIKANVICDGGHILCGICLPRIKQANSCPECRQPMWATPRTIPQFESAIQNHHPAIYARRYKELEKKEPLTWKSDPTFIGTHIQYKAMH